MNVLAYHITWGTYGTRLHGDPRGTVDRQHNQVDSPILAYDQHRWSVEKERLRFPPVRFTRDQMLFIESIVPDICQQGYWAHRASAAGSDHVHIIVSSQHEPQTIPRLLKRWLGQEFSRKYPLPEGATWWSECGSIRWISDESYFRNAVKYVVRQRAGPCLNVVGNNR